MRRPTAGRHGRGQGQQHECRRAGLRHRGADIAAAACDERGLRWQSGANSLLANAGLETRAYGINDAGLVVGRTRYPAGGFLFPTIDVATSWGTLAGNDSSWANAVNRGGQAVGSSYQFVDPTSNRAVLWDGFVATDLNLYLSPEQIQAGWKLYDATGINDTGAILVNGVNCASNEYQAFLLGPVPEPGTGPYG